MLCLLQLLCYNGHWTLLSRGVTPVGFKSIQLNIMRATVQKKLREIRENPRQGVSGLLELAALLSSGHAHDDFLGEARAQLADEESAYYQLVTGLAQQVDIDQLTTFGMNLGYHSLNTGRKMIQKTGAGYHVPWCLFVSGGDAEASLSPALLSRLFDEGQALGIRSYLIDLEPSYPDLGGLLSAMKGAKDCAFVLFLAPEMVTPQTLARLAAVPNLLLLLDLDEEETLSDAAGLLRGRACLCGGFVRYETLEESAPDALAAAADLSLPILMLLDTNPQRPLTGNDATAYLDALRKKLPGPVFPIDLFPDAARIDAGISGAACLAALGPDGRLALRAAEGGYRVTDCSVHEKSLQDCLRHAAAE